MPSLLHEGIVRIFRDRPELAVTLVGDVLGVELPAYSEVRIESADLGDIQPAPRHADLVVLLVEAKPVLGIVVEVQLGADEDKPFTWPAYVVNLRARLRCDVELLVFTPDRAIAKWAMKPVRINQGSVFRPLVVGPDGLPIVHDVDVAAANPELAVLSAMGHGGDEEHVAVPSAHVALAAAAGLEDERALLYSDLVWVGLSRAARAALEALMRTDGYEYQSEFARRYFTAGEAAGKAEGKAEVVLKLLFLKFGELDAETRSRVSSGSVDDLDRWAERVLTATTLAEIFA